MQPVVQASAKTKMIRSRRMEAPRARKMDRLFGLYRRSLRLNLKVTPTATPQPESLSCPVHRSCRALGRNEALLASLGSWHTLERESPGFARLS